MKQIISILFASVICGSTAFAANDFIPFTTIDQAKQYCPPINGLTFTANIPTPDSAGVITGNNRVTFESFTNPPKSAGHPQNMDSTGLIQDAQFRFVSDPAPGKYGYMSNGVVTCFYSYTRITGIQYLLIMRQKGV